LISTEEYPPVGEEKMNIIIARRRRTVFIKLKELL
jgi:hypothetical protein